VKGPVITMQMAKDEGWLDKNGSKWKTMPEVMLRYRAASFFGRLNCPDMIMGIYSADEVVELGPDAYREIDPAEKVQQEIQEKANQEPVDIHVDQDTGEVKEEAQKEATTSAQEASKRASKGQKQQKPEPAEKSPDAGYDPGF
jgi:hypothetical protein